MEELYWSFDYAEKEAVAKYYPRCEAQTPSCFFNGRVPPADLGSFIKGSAIRLTRCASLAPVNPLVPPADLRSGQPTTLPRRRKASLCASRASARWTFVNSSR